ncbi:hypothetical protein BX616_004205 [Lobosporangium transversale]|nr:hypothetical protein BX616_004205 [Lobosporangium transversale]
MGSYTKNISASDSSRDFATIPKEIFGYDIARGTKYSLPPPNASLDDIHHLVYCLRVLSTAPKDLTDEEKDWVSVISDDKDEKKRLRKMAPDVAKMFIRDNNKTKATVAEVVMLAPVLDDYHYTKVISTLIDLISKGIMLETTLLEGLAQLIQYASPGCLNSDDLVNILIPLSSRLQGIHEQSSSHIYQLCVAASHVLDAMVNNQVEGLERKQHEALTASFKRLRDSSDPYLVYHVAYASQALLYIPNDETLMQAMLRRTSAVVQGVFGLVSAVKDINLSDFLHVYNNVVSLAKSGEAFKQCMEEGFSFSRKAAWYPALRRVDAFLQLGELTNFRTLVCEAPCRREPAFQWGLCQRLGQIAADTRWNMKVRQYAVTFLGEMYKNDKDWGDYVGIKRCIIGILKRLTSLSKDDIQTARLLLCNLAMDGDTKKQQLYKDCFQEPEPHPFIYIPSPLESPSLVDRVQDRPDVGGSLRILKQQRKKARGDKFFYIDQYAKASPQASDDKSFLLMDKVNEFLKSEQKVLLIQGDSGAGKSTFNLALERTLWESFREGDDGIPLLINLPAIDNPANDMVAKQLQIHGFTKKQIKELKKNRAFILICDGYDEITLPGNLYFTNRLNQSGEWKCQMVISCRSEYLGIDYRDRFQPMGRNHQADTGLFQEAVIIPFSEDQIDEYIKQYVVSKDILWSVEDYQRVLKTVPSLQALVKNPFILSMSLEVLPRMVDPRQDISKAQIKRITLYDQFIELWFERGKKRLGERSAANSADRDMFQALCDEGFAQNGARYLKELAVAIYKHQGGNPVSTLWR